MKKLNLTFEQVLPHFHKWASYFSNKYFEHWELINSAWCYGKVRFLPQSKIKLASARIKYDMIDYMRRISKERNRKYVEKRGNSYPKIILFSILNGKNPTDTPFIDTISAKLDDNGIEQRDLFQHLLKGLSQREKLIVKLIYLLGYTQKETGKVCGCTESIISGMHSNLMARFRSYDYSKVI